MQFASRSSWTRGGGLPATLVAVLIALLAPAGARAAGTYSQHFCNTGYPGTTGSPLFSSSTAGALYTDCNPAASYPFTGVYYNAASLLEGQGGGVQANAPAGARYTQLAINLRIPWQAANRGVYIVDDQGIVWGNHNSWGGTATWSAGTFPVTLRDSTAWQIVGNCSGSAGSCDAGDWYFDYAVATLSDATAPTVTPANGGVFATARSAFRGSVAATADLVDTGKGPQNAAVQIDGATVASDAWGDGTCNFRLATPCANRLGWSKTIDTAAYTDGLHTVRVRADDGLGNLGTVDRAVTFDNTAPVMGAVPAINGKTVTAATTVLSLGASDATTGVAKLEASVDGGAWTTVANAGNGTVAVAGAGVHDVRVRAVDQVGNVSAQQPVAFTLQAVPANQRLITETDTTLPGAPGPGDTIKCDVGTPWSAGTTFTYKWLRDGAVIDGATAQTYKLVAADADRSLLCRLTAANDAGTTHVNGPVVAAGHAANFGGGADGCYGQPTGATDPCGDFDGDGIKNRFDPDTDNDGVPNGRDPEPYNPPSTDPRVGPDSGEKVGTGTGGSGGSGARIETQNGQGATAAAALAATFEGTKQRRVTVKWGAKRSITGTLTQRTGAPIVGAKIDVTSTDQLMGASPASLGQVVTDSKGRFAYKLAAGLSRTIRFGYKSVLEASSYAQTTEVAVLVIPKVTMRVDHESLRNKQAVTFKGKIAGAPASMRKVVELQALDGTRWRTFTSTRLAKKGGSFKYRYRFQRTTRPTTYRFRAIVRTEKGWPFVTGQSRQIRVKVRP